jgi:hypothetical protein
MIQIDDSGWGSLLGGVMIGMYNTDGRVFKCKLIPVAYFQGRKFKTGAYRDYAVKIFREMLMKIGPCGKMQICRGTVLDGIYNTNGNWKYMERVEIGDPLQSLLEEKFAKSLEKIGVPRKSNGAHCLSFDEQLAWIKERPSRVKYVKTGWNSWSAKYSKQVISK